MRSIVDSMKIALVRGPNVFKFSFVLTCTLLLACPCAFALNPSLDVSQYAHTVWKIRDGFTKGRINSIAQTPDGYLWLGTDLGLLRFDGIRNVPWQPPSDQQLPSSFIITLLLTRDGTLWIGTDKGLASWNRGKLTKYPEVAGHFIFGLMEDRDGAVWVGASTLPTGKLCAIRNGSVQCFGEDGKFGRGVAGLYEDRKGNLWVGAQDGLWRWKPGPPQFFSLPGETIGKQNLAEDLDGVLLIGLDSGIRRLVDGKPEPYPLPSSVRQFRGGKMLRDRDGSLWIGTSIGIVHLHQGRTDVFSSPNGLSSDTVVTLLEDREGNIWVTTSDGLDRFRDFAVPMFSVGQGLSSPIVDSVLAVRDGSVLLTTGGGLNRWSNGQFSPYAEAAQSQESTRATDIPHSLFQDSRGRIWVVTRHEFGYLENDRFIPISGIPGGGARSIAEDATGNLWIANQDSGLLQLFQGRMVQQTLWTQMGHKDFASSLIVDPLQGGVWLGFFEGGVAHFKDGKVQSSYTAADGLGDGFVSDLRLDPDGTLWAATAGGLSRLKNNRIATLTSKNGLPCDAVHWLTDNNDAFWLYTSCGLVRIARAELARWTAAVDQFKDAKQTIQATVFDISDGVRSRTYPVGLSPQVAWSRDGKLWFPAYDGVYVLDPNHLPFNKLPPPVHIEQITADRKTYDTTAANDRLSLPPLVRDLQIDYTALSLVAPEKILFRYKLEGHDRDWQDVANRRQAFYNNLPPGNYRFRVIACNNSGVWNEAGTFLDFSIAPAYYQTTWFRVSLVIAFLFLLAVIYQLRVQQVARQVRGRMEERLDERERIARDLHDTLLQSVQGLILKVHAVSKQITSDAAARDALEKTLDHADQVLAEGRDRVRNLRATATSIDDLPAAFKSVAQETSQGREATFKTVVEGNVRELHPLVQEESYSIGREAIVNALTHSGGRHVEVEITYEPRQFRLRVRDDGRGIDQRILEAGGRADHWGMQGMRERANKIGAELKIWSGHETGTEVELVVPGAAAYQAVGANPNRFWTALYKRLVK